MAIKYNPSSAPTMPPRNREHQRRTQTAGARFKLDRVMRRMFLWHPTRDKSRRSVSLRRQPEGGRPKPMRQRWREGYRPHSRAFSKLLRKYRRYRLKVRLRFNNKRINLHRNPPS